MRCTYEKNHKKGYSEICISRSGGQFERLKLLQQGAVRIIAFYLSPFMPETAEKITRQLGLLEIGSYQWGDSLIGKTVQKGDSLFPRLEQKKKPEPIIVAEAVADTAPESPKALVTIDDFAKIDLRVGIIREAEPVPKSRVKERK